MRRYWDTLGWLEAGSRLKLVTVGVLSNWLTAGSGVKSK
jgi:hypothetical protein